MFLLPVFAILNSSFVTTATDWTSRVVCSLGIIFICVINPAAAATFGNLEYFDEGPAITITGLVQDTVGHIVIPETIDGKNVTKIGMQAFAYREITGVTLPVGLTTLKSAAFNNCRSLTSVIIPGSVTVVEDNVFADCFKLDNVTFLEGAMTVGDRMFEHCSVLKSIVLPTSISNIGNRAFADCYELPSITIPRSVNTVGQGSFQGCFQLVSVTFAEGMKHIPDEMFAHIDTLKIVILPSSLETIGDGAFESCSNIERISLPHNLIYVGNRAFAGCVKITHIAFVSPLLEIGDGAFVHCMGLESIAFPQRIYRIGTQAFASCHKLVEVTLPIIQIPGDYYAFAGCSSLKNIILPEGVNRIDARMFERCNELTNVNIPASVISIGEYAFSRCSKLSKAVFMGNAPVTQGLGSFGIFDSASSDFVVNYYPPATGFTLPTWWGYPTVEISPEIKVGFLGSGTIEDGKGQHEIGTTTPGGSIGREIVIKNIGSSPLTDIKIKSHGCDLKYFQISEFGLGDLNPGEATTVIISFKPLVLGLRTEYIEISSNDSDENPFDLQVVGNCVAVPLPDIAVFQPVGSRLKAGISKKSYGTASVGTRTSAKVFMIRNTGTAALDGISLIKGGSHAGDFIVNGVLPQSLLPGTSTTFKVFFKPTKRGVRNGKISVLSNDSDNSRFDVHLTGEGVQPTLAR